MLKYYLLTTLIFYFIIFLDLKTFFGSYPFWRVNGAIKIVHDKVWVLQRDVGGDEGEEKPRLVVVLSVDVATEVL